MILELVTRRFELVTRGYELVTRGFELVTRQVKIKDLNSHFLISTRAFELSTCNS